MAAILVFAITDEASFDKLKDWVRELQTNVEEPLVLAIACNKADMAESRRVSYDTAAQYAASINALIFETSAKKNTGERHTPRRRPATLSLPPRDARSVTRHVARAGITELFSEVARRLLLTRFRTDDPTGVHLAELPDPLSEMGKKKGCC